jgi:hypothetical protein
MRLRFVLPSSLFAAAIVAEFSFSPQAHAESDDSSGEGAATARAMTWHADASRDEAPSEQASKAGEVRDHAEERPFAYLLDPTTPSAGDVGLEYRFGLASGVPAERPLPATVGSYGVQHTATVDYGATNRIAPFASVLLLEPNSRTTHDQVTGTVGARFQITPPDSRARLTVAGAGFREFSGDIGTYVRVAASYDWSRLRVAANFHGEHVFAAGRDAVDILVLAGASYRLLEPLRVGFEYVGQDVEETFDAGAEGGARNFVGPDVALDFADHRISVVASIARCVGLAAPPLMGSLAVLSTF